MLTFCAAYRSDNFVIGLTNVSPLVTAPTLWNYTVCGQYPGDVGSSATVNLKCASCMPAYRYLIVQFPVADRANFCELEVYIRRKFFFTENTKFHGTCLTYFEYAKYYCDVEHNSIVTKIRFKIEIITICSAILVHLFYLKHFTPSL